MPWVTKLYIIYLSLSYSAIRWHWHRQISSKKLPLFDSLTLFEEWTCPATPAQPCCWERKQPKGRISIQLQACSRFVFSGFGDLVPPRVVLPGTSRCSNGMQWVCNILWLASRQIPLVRFNYRIPIRHHSASSFKCVCVYSAFNGGLTSTLLIFVTSWGLGGLMRTWIFKEQWKGTIKYNKALSRSHEPWESWPGFTRGHPEGLVGLDVLGTYVRVQMGQQSYCTETASEDSSWILGRLLAMMMVM